MPKGIVPLVFAVLLVAACSRSATTDVPAEASLVTFKVAGSTALLPFVTRAANSYMAAHPSTAIQVEAGGSRAGLALVGDGKVAIGTSDIFCGPDLAAKLEDHRIGVVGFAAMANRGPFNASIASLSLDQLRRIFVGEARDWADVGGGHQPIVVINRPKSSGTRAAFGAIVLGGDHFAPGSLEEESSAQVQTTLLSTTGAISYLALSYRHADLAVFAVDGTPATSENIANGGYPIWSYEHMYTLGPAAGEVRAFVDFVLSPPMQEDTLASVGFIPVSKMKTSRAP